jgi:LmbE family N-acetylglucosaminyl deacetylase
MEKYRPQVVVTYDANGNYGHPDHIQAHRVTMAASQATGVPAKVYFSAVPRSGVAQLRQMLEAAGVAMDNFNVPDDFGTPDDEITTVVDVSAHVDQKLAALDAHASQTENFFFKQLPGDLWRQAMSREAFILSGEPPGAVPEDDLFAGLRQPAHGPGSA